MLSSWNPKAVSVGRYPMNRYGHRSFFSSKADYSAVGRLSCRKCTFISRDPLAMAAHKSTCTGKRHLTCPICAKVLSRYDALTEHMRGRHGVGKKADCKYCGKSFKYRPQMYQHQAICEHRFPHAGNFLNSESRLTDPRIELDMTNPKIELDMTNPRIELDIDLMATMSSTEFTSPE